MQLFYRQLGHGPALIILHGLYGSSDNWMTLARQWAPQFSVYLVDQRNHGQSPHAAEHNYQSMSDDLHEFICEHKINRPYLLGHSMGGKTVMTYALQHPENVAGLIVVDIAPKIYSAHDLDSGSAASHQQILDIISHLDLSLYKNREAVELAISPRISDWRTRQFLLKNLKRNTDGSFRWAIHVEALQQHLPEIMGALPEHDKKYQGLTLFVKGALSNYIQTTDYDIIHKQFPQAQIVTIPQAGHWIHADQPDLLYKNVNYFAQ